MGGDVMSTREDAQAFLAELYSSIPRSFYSELEMTRRGFGFVLDYLEQAKGEVTAGDLAKTMEVSPARVAILLKKMEESGFIVRHTSSKDARRIIVEITPAGVAYVDDMKERTLNKVESLLNQVSKEELYAYVKISRKIREAMEE